MPEPREHITFDSNTLQMGYQQCRTAVKRHFRPLLWTLGNLSGSQRRDLDPILQHGVRVANLLDLESPNGLSLEVWHETRDDLSDAFSNRYATPEFAALIDTARRHNIAKQFLFDPINGADLWIRNRKFKTYDELSGFASLVGGSILAAAVGVVGTIKPGYEPAAVECGKAILLTHLLSNCVNDAKVNKLFLAEDDLNECEIVVHRLKLRQGGTSLKNFVRLYCWRIEKSLTEGSKLIPYLDFDARRSVTSLLAFHWKKLMKMKLDPDSVLQEDGVLTSRERFKLRTRHLLGMEGNVPFIETETAHH